MDITPADVVLNSPTAQKRDLEQCHQVGIDDQPFPSASGAPYDAHERSSLPIYQAGDVPDSPDSPPGSNGRPGSRTRYDAVGLGPAPPPRDKPIRAGSAFYTPMPTRDPSSVYPDGGENRFEASFSQAVTPEGRDIDEEPVEESDRLMGGGRVDRDGESPVELEKRPVGGTRQQYSRGILGALQGWMRGWSVQMGKLFAPRWRRTVILMWIIWGSMSFAYTMFNVWLPAVLESRSEGEGDEAIKSGLTKFVLYSGMSFSFASAWMKSGGMLMCSCWMSRIDCETSSPSVIDAESRADDQMGAWMIQTALGRRKSLAICTLATGISTFIFIRVKSDTAVVVSSMFISTAATAMYAVLCE